MSDDGKNTLLIHDSTPWRTRLGEQLTLDGRGFTEINCLDDLANGEQAGDVGAVIIQVEGQTDRSIPETLSQVRERFPDRPIIAVVQQRNASGAREAFRSGAWDCFEENVETKRLCEALENSIQDRPLPGTQQPAIDTKEDQTLNLPGHSVFLEALAGLRSLCRRNNQPLSIAMFDLDRFHRCNEHHSPAVGDEVLRWFAETLTKACRRSDMLAQYQADRFVVALPDSRAAEAAGFARRCRQAMAEFPPQLTDASLEITTAVGIAESSVGFIETEHQLIKRARISLDQAKNAGGDQMVTWSELQAAQPTRRELEQLTPQGVSHWVERTRQHLRSTYLESTRALVAAVEAKDPYTERHSLTVAAYAEAIGKRMRLSTRMLETLRVAALLHDVGKIGVPDAILTKPGPLTSEEFEIVKRHPETALEILGHVSFLSDERPIILHHHERYDGGGYPAGLVGDQIPIGARILTVADAIDTMFSPRSYKLPYEAQHVRRELIDNAGKQFDAEVAEVALEWINDTMPNGPNRLQSHSFGVEN